MTNAETTRNERTMHQYPNGERNHEVTLKQAKQIDYYGHPAEITATAKLSQFGGQAPYLSVTGEVWELSAAGKRRDKEPVTCGRLDDLIAEHLPAFRPLLPFILCAVPGVPMHYKPNAAFWYDKIAGRSKFKPASYEVPAIEAFKHTVAYGMVEGDESCPLPLLVGGEPHPEGGDMRPPFSPDELSEWLDGRLPKLCEAFKVACEGAGLTF